MTCLTFSSLVQSLNLWERIKTITMKIYSIILFLLVCITTLSGCEVVGTIFKAGMWWAFFLMALVIGIVIYIMMKVRKK